MKHFLALLLLLTLLPASAVKKITPNPINLAIILVEKTDSAKVASTLKYYGYTPQGKEDGYQIMKDSNGNEIRYSYSNTTHQNKYPQIIVRNHETHKSLDSRLQELNFKKVGRNYERAKNQYSRFKTKCSFGPHGTLIIQRMPQ